MVAVAAVRLKDCDAEMVVRLEDMQLLWLCGSSRRGVASAGSGAPACVAHWLTVWVSVPKVLRPLPVEYELAAVLLLVSADAVTPASEFADAAMPELMSADAVKPASVFADVATLALVFVGAAMPASVFADAALEPQ